MAPEKRNQFLDAGDSDEDGSEGYNSEADEVTKGGRSAKRRRIDGDSDSDNDDFFDAEEKVHGEGEDLEDEEDDDGGHDTELAAKKSGKSTRNNFDDDSAAEADDSESSTKKAPRHPRKPSMPRASDELPGLSKSLSKKAALASEKAIKRSGVVYISRVPPYLTPHKLRSLLTPYGEINRIFLSPEDESARSRRVRAGGNKKKSFTDGWVEFVRKRDAKRAVDLLNAHTIGGKKGSWYRDDLWSLKYLHSFKWHHLTAQISEENAARASRLRAEVAKTNRENMDFKKNVLEAKEMEGMKAKRQAKRKRDGVDDAAAEDGTIAAGRSTEKVAPVRTFKQTPVAAKGKEKGGSQAEQLGRVLSSVF